MKLTFNWILFIFLLISINFISCEKEVVRPPKIEEPVEPTKKEFEIYEWMGYKDKPDLLSEKISKIYLIGESQLTKPDPTGARPKGVLDWDKITLQAQQAKMSGYKFIQTDIETWWGVLNGETYASDHDEMFKYFRKEIPGAVLGAYGIPVSTLNLRRWKREHLPEQEIIDEWKKSSEWRMLSGAISDVLSPSLYIATRDTTQWLKDLETMVTYLKEKFPNKKIYGYLWPQYYDFADSPLYKKFIEPEIWNALLEGAYKHLDGVILWAGGTDANGNIVSWNDSPVQEFWKETKKFIAKYSENIKVVAPEYEGDETKEPTVFHMYQSIKFDGTPADLTSYGLKPIRLVSGAELSVAEADPVTGINSPDAAKIEALAVDALQNPNVPVVINNIDNWIRDRTSNNQAMADRFKLVKETFKSKNNSTKLGYQGVGPTSMSGLRLTEGRTEFQITDSWFRYAAQPMRTLRQHADILIPTPMIIDDNLTVWKGDCVRILIEAKNNNPEKPIYAYLWTNYFNRSDSYPFFADAYKPIKEQTFYEALEFIYQRCDGVIIVSNAPKDNPVTWDNNLGVIKAIKRFYENHKNVIGEIPYEEPEDPGETSKNLIANGGFEEAINPHSTEPSIHGMEKVRLARVRNFFDKTSQITFPTFSAPVEIPDNVWFHRTSNNNRWFLFNYIEEKDAASTKSKEIPNSGEKSLALYYAFGEQKINTNDFLMSLAQRVQLDDTKKYNFKFFVQRDETVWGTGDGNKNYAEKINIGIISSNDDGKDYTYYTTFDLPKNGDWTEVNVTIDLPQIISNNKGKSFNNSAVFISLVPTQFNEKGQLLKHQVNIDDVSLTEMN